MVVCVGQSKRKEPMDRWEIEEFISIIEENTDWTFEAEETKSLLTPVFSRQNLADECEDFVCFSFAFWQEKG